MTETSSLHKSSSELMPLNWRKSKHSDQLAHILNSAQVALNHSTQLFSMLAESADRVMSYKSVSSDSTSQEAM